MLAKYIILMTTVAVSLPVDQTEQQFSDGACVGDAFISRDAISQTLDGPDFTVDYFRTAAGPIGVYFGCCSQVHDAERAEFAQVDGQSVFRVSDEGVFRGYLIDQVRVFNGKDWHSQYHFFGEGFVDGEEDMDFFRRLSFEEGKIRACGRHALPTQV